MDCIAWIVNQINANVNIIDKEEMWYKPGNSMDTTIANNEGEKLFQSWKVKSLSRIDLEEEATSTSHAVTSLIHDSFAVESRYRRLQRKRRCRTSYNDRTSADEHSTNEPQFEDEDGSVDEPVDHSQHSVSRSLLEPVESSGTVAVLAQTSEADKQEQSSSGEAAFVPQTPILEDAYAEESISPRIQSPSPWVMNDDLYLAKVCQLLHYEFYWKKHTKAHVLSFEARKREANKKEKSFWTKPDPKIDAWMLVVGEVREVFDLNGLVSNHPEVEKYVASFRKSVNVLILSCSCPVVKARKLLKRDEERIENRNEADDEDEVEGPGNLSSQTYWTTIKKWSPW